MQNSLGNRHAVGKFCNKMTAPDCKTRPYTSKSKVTSARASLPLLKTGFLAAHRVDCLMLLGSPPDMIHSFRLRKTHFSTQRQRFIRQGSSLRRGIHPCYSGFQVQGSATPPAGMASFYSLIPYVSIIPDFFPFCKRFSKKSLSAVIFSVCRIDFFNRHILLPAAVRLIRKRHPQPSRLQKRLQELSVKNLSARNPTVFLHFLTASRHCAKREKCIRSDLSRTCPALVPRLVPGLVPHLSRPPHEPFAGSHSA